MAIQASAFSKLSVEKQITLLQLCLDQGFSLRGREVCGVWKVAIDEMIISKWNQLKKSPPGGPIQFAMSMLNQERLQGPPRRENALALFRGVNDVFRKCIDRTFSGELRIDPGHFQALQLETYQELVGRSLMATWDRIWPQMSMFVGSFSTPTEIREWLNDPQTEPCRRAIVEINLRDLGIRYVPVEICQFPNLDTLNLSENHIDVLPSFLGKIPSLRTLLLKNNYLEELPEEFSNWGHIETIDLSENPLGFQALGLLLKWQKEQEEMFRMDIEV